MVSYWAFPGGPGATRIYLEDLLSGGTDQKITLVITNYNGRDNLERCLPAVMKTAAYANLCDEVLVVDDCSADDSLEFLAQEYPQVRTLALKRRSSFLGAANAGFQAAKNRFVALLSNDMVPAKDFLARLLPHFDDPQVFAAHACLYDDEGKLESERAVGRFLLGNLKMINTARPDKGLARLLLPQRAPTTDSLYCGGCALFDRDKFMELGGYDDLYLPFYWEDVDLCFRAWRLGWRIVCEPGSRVMHHRKDGAIATHFDRSFVRSTERRNRFLFLWINLDSPVYLLPHFLHLFVSFIISAPLGRFGFYRSLFQGLKRLPEVFARRQNRPTPVLTDAQIFTQVLGAPLVSESSAFPALGRTPERPRTVADLEIAGPLEPG